MDEQLRFVARMLEGLADRSRRPYLLAGVEDTPRPASNGDHAKTRKAHDSHREMSLEPWFSLRRLSGQILVKPQCLFTPPFPIEHVGRLAHGAATRGKGLT